MSTHHHPLPVGNASFSGERDRRLSARRSRDPLALVPGEEEPLPTVIGFTLHAEGGDSYRRNAATLSRRLTDRKRLPSG